MTDFVATRFLSDTAREAAIEFAKARLAEVTAGFVDEWRQFADVCDIHLIENGDPDSPDFEKVEAWAYGITGNRADGYETDLSCEERLF